MWLLCVCLHLIIFFIYPEPIIAPVKKKKFTMAEQDLPATTYDMEWVFSVELSQENFTHKMAVEPATNSHPWDTKCSWQTAGLSNVKIYFNIIGCY